MNVFHVPGKLNVVPDALSRLPVEATYYKVAEASTFDELDNAFHATPHESSPVISDEFHDAITQGYGKDAKLGPIVDFLQRPARETQTGKGRRRRNKVPLGPWELQPDGLLYHRDTLGIRRLCVPTACIKSLLELVHDNKHHFGPARMLAELNAVHFHRKSRQARTYVAHCPVCRENATNRDPPQGELQPIPTEPLPFKIIALDFITDLPSIPATGTMWQTPGYDHLDCLCPLSCKFSKKTLLVAGHTTMKAGTWAILILRSLLMADWGIPTGIISDRDPKFTSDIWKAIFSLLNVKALMATAYHAQTNGLAERKNQTVEIAIRYHTATSPSPSWVDMLPALQHHLNNAYTEAIGRSPNELVYGFKPDGITEALARSNPTTSNTNAIGFQELRRLHAEEAVIIIDIAAAHAKLHFDKTHQPVDINVGDTVYLKLHHGYHQPGKPKKKWSATRMGPYQVLQKIGTQAYRLDFPPDSQIHPVVSAVHLWKPPQGPDPFQRTIPPPGPVIDNVDPDESQWEIDRIVTHKVTWYRKQPRIKFLVRWKGYTAKDDS